MTDPDNRLSQGARPHAADSGDAGDAAEHAGAGGAVDGEQGLRLDLQRRLAVHDRRQPLGVGHDLEELPAACRRQLPPRRQVGAPLRLRAVPDAAQQRARHARRLRQPVHRLRADHEHPGAVQRPPAAGAERSIPGQQPGAGRNRPDPRALHRPRQPRQLRSVRAAAADQRSLQPVVPAPAVGRHRRRCRLLLQPRLARALHAQPEHARPDVHLRERRGRSTPR